MKWNNMIRVSFKSLMKNRMRSLLTSLGIIIGVGAVIIMVAIGEGAQRDIEDRISSLGANLIMVFPSVSRMGGVSQGRGTFNRLTMDDAEVLQEQLSLARAVSPMINTRAQVIGGEGNWNTSVSGVWPGYLEIREWTVAEGEVFNERDLRVRSKVAVVGRTVVENLFPDREPLGRRIRVDNVPMKIIGVLEELGQDAGGRDQDDVILVPATTVLNRLRGGQFIDMIYISAVSTDLMQAAQNEIEQVLRNAHKLNPTEDADFTVFNQEQIIATVSATTRTLTLLLGSIAGVSLIVGGIGIMNIMLVSVTERTREIGLRMAIGARRRDILVQFLTEAVVLSVAGGAIGIILSFGASRLLTRMTSITTSLNPGIMLVAVFFSAAVGIFFGFYPARKAAALHPIDALRYE